ncbi:MAG: AsmA-like C-terminal region-containing protein [Pseudomonadota bacterium]
MKGPRGRQNARAATPVRRGARRRHTPAPLAGFFGFMFRETGSIIVKAMTFLAVAMIAFLVVLDGRELVVELDPRIQNWVAGRLGADSFEVGTVAFRLGVGDDAAGVTLNDLRIGGTDQMPAISLPELRTDFMVMEGLQGQLRPRNLTFTGIELTFTRTASGALDLAGNRQGTAPVRLFGGQTGTPVRTPDFGALLNISAQLDRVALLRDLESVDFTDVYARFFDERTGEVWVTHDARAELRRDPAGTSGSLNATLRQAGRTPLPVQVRFATTSGNGQTRYQISVEEAQPADLAEQIPVLDWLSLIDAPVSGTLAAVLDSEGALLSFSGQLRLGAGTLVPRDGIARKFNGAEAYFAFDPVEEVFRVTSLKIDSPYGTFASNGRVNVERTADGAGVRALVAQMHLSNVEVAPPDLPRQRLRFLAGAAVARVNFRPFSIDVGELSVRNGTTNAAISGRVAPHAGGWDVALDAYAHNVTTGRVLSFWPPDRARRLREWLETHIQAGMLTRADVFIRNDSTGPRFGLDFDFVDARARILPDFPLIVGGRGSGQLIDGRFDLVLDRGSSLGGLATGIDLAGSRMAVPDTRQRPARAEFALTGDGSLRAVLDLIDRAPLNLLTRAGQGTDLARGRGSVELALAFPLKRELKVADFEVETRADLRDVTSDVLAPGRVIAADTASLFATTSELRVDGAFTVDGVPVQAAYAARFGPDAPPAQVTGTLDVTPETLDGLGIPLPPGAIAGRGDGRFALQLPRDEPLAYQVDVDLAGAAVSIPALNWRKSPRAAGDLTVRGRFADPVEVDYFALDGPGLSLRGALDLSGGRLSGGRLSRLRLPPLIDAPVAWRTRPGTPTQVSIDGGRIDLRGGLPGAAGDGAGGGAGIDLALAPDEVIASESIRLTGLRGSLSTDGGTRGRFTAAVNGGAQIAGVIQSGGRVFIEAQDGGAVLRDAGVYPNARSGTLRLSVEPGGAGAPIQGVFSLRDTRIVNAPGVARLLADATIERGAEEMRRAGIPFDDAQGRYAIADDRVYISGGRAVGPSLGITVQGNYDMARGALQLDGVVSPFYAVNGLIERLPGLGRLLGGRPGEGILGANFSVRGTAQAPEISVNPLSLLAPGAARELFQSRAPGTPGG